MASVWLALGVVVCLFVIVQSSKANAPRPVKQMPEPGPDVHALINEKRKVEAIKLYRKQTPASLLEAKQVVEHYM